jgi:hypothetical protein
MKTESPSPLTPRCVLLYVLAYVLWLVATVACVMAVIQLRSTGNAIWVILGGDRYSLDLVNQLILLLGGLTAFVYVMWLESHYRESVTHKERGPEAGGDVSGQAPALHQDRLPRWLTRGGVDVLLRRFATTTAIPLGIVVLSLATLEVAMRVVYRK